MGKGPDLEPVMVYYFHLESVSVDPERRKVSNGTGQSHSYGNSRIMLGV